MVSLPDLGEPDWVPHQAPRQAPRPAWLTDPRVTTFGARAVGLERSGAGPSLGVTFLLRLQRRRARWRTSGG